jgi:DNA gyrase subunit A
VIRVPVEGIRIAGRSSKGVRIFNTAEDEKVVSVDWLSEELENGNDEDGEDATEAGAPDPEH